MMSSSEDNCAGFAGPLRRALQNLHRGPPRHIPAKEQLSGVLVRGGSVSSEHGTKSILDPDLM
jgi:hypothetical protein